MKKQMMNRKGILFFLLLTMDAINVAFMAVLLKQTLDVAISGNLDKLMETVLCILVFLVEYSLVGLGTRTVKVSYISDVMLAVKKKLLSNLLNKNVKSYSDKNSAEYISLFNNELKMLEDNYIISIITIYRSIIILIVSLSIMVAIQPIVSLIAILLSFLPVLIPKLLGKKLSEATQNYTKQLKKYNRFIDDILRGFYVVKNFCLEAYMDEKHHKENEQVELMRRKLGKQKAYADVITNFIAVGMQFGVFAISGFFVVLRWITAGDVLAITQLMSKVVNPVFDVIDSLNKIKSVKEIEKDIENMVREKKEEMIIDNRHMEVKTITLKNVSFSYDKGEKILSNVNLKLERGKKYAIVGETGSGKSTLIRLIQGYFENYDGEIYYNDIDIREIGQEKCFQVFSYMSQDIFLFEGTIKENIVFDHKVEEDVLQNTIKAVKLDETFQKNGIDFMYELTNCGENMSGGEREKIALARLLLHKRDWLLLDEATASMDNETLLQIEETLLKLCDVTCISITHRYQEDVLRKYDQIIVIKKGRIVETGKLEEFISKESILKGLYRGKT